MSSQTVPSASSADPRLSFESELDLRLLARRIRTGLWQITALSLIGLSVGIIASVLGYALLPKTASTRVFFSFPGFEHGEYPDHSKFQPDDIRAPAVIQEALLRQGLDLSIGFQSKVRGGISIEAIIPANITRERDKLRASGQTPPPYIANEYVVSLSLRAPGLSGVDCKRLLNEIISTYSTQFQHTYSKLPEGFGNAFATLESADFPEYQLILDKEIQNLTNFLNNQLEDAKAFRSRKTNLSYSDLIAQTEIFSQLRLNETLGIIYQNGLSRDRRIALVKMDYYLRTLDDQEHRAVEESNVIDNLLSKAEGRTQGYVLGIKSQTEKDRPETAVVDEGLINTLLKNDAYNFLVRRSLEAGIHVKQIQSDKARLIALRENMKSFMNRDPGDQSAIMVQVEKSLQNLRTAYQQLIKSIRETHEDYAEQEFGNAIRVSDGLRYPSWIDRGIAYALAGLTAGLAAGTGLSLLGLNLRNLGSSFAAPRP